MPDVLSRAKLKILPLHLIEMSDGIILKRGCTEVRVRGEEATQNIRRVLARAAIGATLAELLALAAAPDRPKLGRLLGLLIQARLLVSIDDAQALSEPESTLDIFYWHFGSSAAQVIRALNSRCLIIVGINGISLQLATACTVSGWENFKVVDDPLLRNLRMFHHSGRLIKGSWSKKLPSPIDHKEWMRKVDRSSWDCLIATSDFGAQESMREWNRFCVERGSPFLPVVLQDITGYVGPLVVPGETACFECLRLRQNAHLEDIHVQRAAEAEAFVGQKVVGFHPSMASILGDLAAIELTKFLSGILPEPNIGKWIEVNLLETSLRARRVLKMPRCLVCSPLNSRPSKSPYKPPPLTQAKLAYEHQ
jgi:thiazole/oxazole-forming peptide maturase SagC family component